MSSRTMNLTDSVYQYLLDHSLRESEELRQLRDETRYLQEANMQVSPEQGQLMRLLVSLTGARRALEIGVFTGYSSICIAQALPEGGELVGCDLSEEWTSIAQRYWRKSGVADKIRLRLGPAVDTLKSLVAEGNSGQFDVAFIDADKENSEHYYELCLELLRPGGLLMIDNVLWGGRVASEEDQSVDTVAIRALNERVHNDDRVDMSLLPVSDGLTLAMKKH